MITYNIFLWSGVFILVLLIVQSLKWLTSKVKDSKNFKETTAPYMTSIWRTMKLGPTVVAFCIFLLSLTLGHIVPYLSQERDHMLIMEYNDNINLYNQYSEDYATAARQQIEQYQAMQSEMARTATIAQLQFFAEQEDSVGNSLTNEIRRFQELIMEQELEINKAHSRVMRRPLNKWFFGIQ